jgi:hypothetical protein
MSDDVNVRFTVTGLQAITAFRPESLPWLDISAVEFTLDVRDGAGTIALAGTAPRERLPDIVQIAQESLDAIRKSRPQG